MKIPIEKLKFNKSNEEYPEGYRLVYFYDNDYSIGEYSKTIKGFMQGFCESYPIMDDGDIPKFSSIDDLLNRCINDVNNVKRVAIYHTNGQLIAEKSNDIVKNSLY